VRALVRTVVHMPAPQLDPERVIRARYDLGLSAAELARRSGLSKQLISDIEHGRRPGSAESQKAIADVLGVAPSNLWIKEAA
jgi:transcriptional regulator with XRE-family HTH domain